MTISEFLLARIEEDEALAREEDDDYADTTLLPTYDSEHQANWNTARVLAECAAKRAIIERCERLEAKALNDDLWNVDEYDSILEALATVYADHPDYQKDWGPEV